MEALVLDYHVEKNQKMWNFILIRALFWTVLWKRAIFTKKAFKGRTPLIRAPIGFYAKKVRLFKARFEGEAAIF